MSDLVTRLRLDSGQHNSELDKSKQKVHQYKEEADKAGKSVEEMGSKQTRSAKELLDAMSKIEGQTRSTSNYRAQLAQITKQISDLTINYRAMNAEMQNSDFGQEVASKIQELTNKAAGYKDAIIDAQSSIKAIASDTSNWDAVAQGIDLVSSSLQTFVAAGVLGEKSTERLVEIISKLKAMETATNAVIKIGNALQRESSLMIRIQALQTNALAKAKNLEAAATGKATIAQKLFNAVAKANPYVLLASVVIGLVSALAIFTRRTKEDTDAQKEHKETLEKQNKVFESYKSTVGNSVGSVLAQYTLLQNGWKNLSSEHEKKKWIDENQTAFHNLGLSINNVNDANKIFVSQANDVVAALRAIAEAEALKEMYQSEYKKSIEAEIQANHEFEESVKNLSATAYLQDNLKGSAEMWKRAAITTSDYNTKIVESVKGGVMGSYRVLNESGKAKVLKALQDMAEEARQKSIDAAKAGLEEMSKYYEDAEKKALDAKDKLAKMSSAPKTNLTGAGAGLSGVTLDVEVDTDSLTAAQQEVSRLTTLYEAAGKKNENFAKLKEDLENAKKKLEELKKEYYQVADKVEDNEDSQIFEPYSLDWARAKVADINKELSATATNTPRFSELLGELKTWEGIQNNIEQIIDNSKKDITSTEAIIEQMDKALASVQKNYELGLVDESVARQLVANINREFKKNNIDLTYSLKLKETNLDKGLEAFSKYKNSINDFASSISRAYDSIADLGDKLEEEKDVVKRFFMVWDAVSNVVSGVETLVATGNAIVKFLDDKVAQQGADAAAAAADAAATQALATAQQNLAAASGEAATGLGASTTAATADATATAADAAAAGTAAAAKTAEAAASAANTAASETETAAKGKSVIAKIADAIAGAAEAVSSIPVIGPVLAVAAIAAVIGGIIAAISKAKSQKFTRGGIFKAPSGVGDKNYAQLNNGEMVLNTQQQKKLFQMLNSTGIIDNNTDSGSGVGGNVRFVIEGDKLVGTLDNYNRKIYHSRR